MKFVPELSRYIWASLDWTTWVISQIPDNDEPKSRGKRKQKVAIWNREIWTSFEDVTTQIFPEFTRENIRWSEDLCNWSIWIEVKSGKIKGSHAVINESQIANAIDSFWHEAFYYVICYYSIEQWQKIPQNIFVFPLPVIISFFNQSRVIPYVSPSGRLRRFVVMKVHHAINLFLDIQENYWNSFRSRVYSVERLGYEKSPTLFIVDNTAQDLAHILSLDTSLFPSENRSE